MSFLTIEDRVLEVVRHHQVKDAKEIVEHLKLPPNPKVRDSIANALKRLSEKGLVKREVKYVVK